MLLLHLPHARETETVRIQQSNRHSVKAHPFFPNDQGEPSKEVTVLTKNNSNGETEVSGHRHACRQGTHRGWGVAGWWLGLVEDPHTSPAWDQHIWDDEEEGWPDL